MVVSRKVSGSWYLEGACRGPGRSVFFPPTRSERRKEKRRREQKAKAICSVCSVNVQCLQYAFTVKEDHGIWGGLTRKERRQLRKKPQVVQELQKTEVA